MWKGEDFDSLDIVCFWFFLNGFVEWMVSHKEGRKFNFVKLSWLPLLAVGRHGML